jgi:hypothetical protein
MYQIYMDKYYYKYLKYKKKYLELKENKDKSNETNYILTLKKLYPSCVHDHGTIEYADIDEIKKQEYATTYGEMDYPAIELFNNKFNPHNEIKYFIDFGSGRGKLPLFMAFYVEKSFGIELVKNRHDDAVKLKEQLAKEYSKFTNKVELLNTDMFDFLKTINKNTFKSPVLIWISNLCFSEKITSRLFNELLAKMPSGSIIGCSKIPNVIPEGIIPLNNENGTNKLIVKMSWSETSVIYIYKIK